MSLPHLVQPMLSPTPGHEPASTGAPDGVPLHLDMSLPQLVLLTVSPYTYLDRSHEPATAGAPDGVPLYLDMSNEPPTAGAPDGVPCT